jgi:uncharacterized delta-60 repeat protein
MKKALLLFNLLVFGFFQANAQPGSLDLSFHVDGYSDLSVNGNFSGMELQADGKIIVLSSDESLFENKLVRYLANGDLDLSFNGTGIVLYNNNTVFNDIAVQADGKYVAVGFRQYFGAHDAVVVRFNSDGTLDNTFGTGGEVTATFSDYDFARKVELQSDGKIVIAGYYEQLDFMNFTDFLNGFVMRFNSNGTTDNTFGTFGSVILSHLTLGSSVHWIDHIGGLIIEPNGNITVAGTTTVVYAQDSFVWRLTPTGDYDVTFDGDGYVVFDIVAGISLNNFESLDVQSNGNYVLCGSGFNPFVMNLTSSGALNTGFDSDGILLTGNSSTPKAVKVLNDN